MKFSKAIIFCAFTSAALTGCNPEEWPGAGSDYNLVSQDGGYNGIGGAHFNGWGNNAYGPASTFIPVLKDHPPLYGATICIIEHPEYPCAITGEDGSFDFYGIPNENVHLAISLTGYMPLIIPYAPAQGDYENHPAVEIPSLSLQDMMYSQINTSYVAGTGGMSFHITNKPDLLADPLAEDHSEASTGRPGVAVRYRRIYTNSSGVESFGGWSNPSSWILGHNVVYLNNDESPEIGALHTANSGLGISLNLVPGDYEVEADDTNYSGGFGTLLTTKHWDCWPVNKSIIGSNAKRARTKVVDGHLSDVRMYCNKS